MKNVIRLVALSFALSAGFAQAADAPKKEPSEKQAAQQEKMKACNKEAGDKKLAGDARKAFMKDCLSAKGDAKPADAKAAPSACEGQAADKKLAGAAKASFVKKCEADAKGADAVKACEGQAAEKKLAGAAKTSFLKKCEADAKK